MNSAWAEGFSCEVTHVVVSRKPQLFARWTSHDLAASPEQVIPDRQGDPQYSYDLIWEVHTCCILLVTQSNPHTVRAETTRRQECQEGRLTGGRLGDWLLWRSHCNRTLSAPVEISKTLCYPLCKTSSLKVGACTKSPGRPVVRTRALTAGVWSLVSEMS